MEFFTFGCSNDAIFTPAVFTPVYRVTLNHLSKPEHTQFFPNQHGLANLAPIFLISRLHMPCSSVWQSIPGVLTLHCGLSNSSAKLVLRPQFSGSVQELSALSRLMGRKKKQSSTAESESLYCGFWSWGETRLSRSRCSFLCPDSVTLISRLSPMAPFFPQILPRFSHTKAISLALAVYCMHTRELNRRAWNEKMYISNNPWTSGGDGTFTHIHANSG